MDWIDLGNPRPRTSAIKYRPHLWPPALSIVPLERPLTSSRPFVDVIGSRSSCREFVSVAASEMLGALAALFWLACRTKIEADDSLGFPIAYRPSPSAGAIHPIHILTNVPGFQTWHYLDARRDQLVEMQHEAVSVADVRGDVDRILPGRNASLVLFIAEPGKTSAKYLNSASLVWRDAGVLQGIISLAAEDLNLGCTMLGVTGEPWSGRLLGRPGLHGVGAAYVGFPGLTFTRRGKKTSNGSRRK